MNSRIASASARHVAAWLRGSLPGVAQAQRAVERHPAHHLGVGEVRAARCAPPRCRSRARARCGRRGRRSRRAAGRSRGRAVRRPRRRSARSAAGRRRCRAGSAPRRRCRPARARAAVAVQLERALRRALAAVEAVEDLQPRVGQLRRVQQPPEERVGLARAAQLQQRLERERRVAHPAEAVVPVALAADLLGQRRRGRRRDRARGAWKSSLSASALRITASRHGPVVGALRGPAAPVGGRRLAARLDLRRASGRPAAPGGRRTARSAPTRTPSERRSARRSRRRRSRPRRRPRSRRPARRGRRSRPVSRPRRSSAGRGAP